MPTDKLYTGQRLDSTGLYFYNARYYDPTIGRFISPDTLVPSFLDPQSLNRYSYAYNNPLRYWDPTGHFGLGDVGSFFKGVGKAAVNTVKATVQMVTNPVQTVEALGYAATHPVETVQAIASSYAQKAQSAEGIGEIVGEIAIMALGGAGAAAAGKAITKVAEVVRGAEIAEQATSSVFYAGKGARAAAEGLATDIGGTTLSRTATGQMLDSLIDDAGYQAARPVLENASREFAAGASGDVFAVQSSSGVSIDSIYGAIEYPTLINNPNVTRIIDYVLMPDGSLVYVP